MAHVRNTFDDISCVVSENKHKKMLILKMPILKRKKPFDIRVQVFHTTLRCSLSGRLRDHKWRDIFRVLFGRFSCISRVLVVDHSSFCLLCRLVSTHQMLFTIV